MAYTHELCIQFHIVSTCIELGYRKHDRLLKEFNKQNVHFLNLPRLVDKDLLLLLSWTHNTLQLPQCNCIIWTVWKHMAHVSKPKGNFNMSPLASTFLYLTYVSNAGSRPIGRCRWIPAPPLGFQGISACVSSSVASLSLCVCRQYKKGLFSVRAQSWIIGSKTMTLF